MTRRAWLAAAAGALSAFRPGIASATPQAPIPSWPTELRSLRASIYAYTQAGGPGIDNASLSNAGVIASGDTLLAIDTLGPPIHAKAFKAAAERATGKRFGRVINTHHHRDHTNGNCFFPGIEILASSYTREATIEQGIPAMPYDTRPEWQAGMNELRLAPATKTVEGRATHRYGDLVVELIPNAPAHTWGDVMVHLPQQRILFAGDVAFFYVTPAAHNGHIAKWIEAIDRVLAMDVDLIVPGHGPVGTKDDLRISRRYLEYIAEETPRRYRAGMTPGRAAADIDLKEFAGWPNVERAAWNTVRLYAEYAGTLTPRQDLAAQNAAVEEFTRLRRLNGA